MVGFEVSLRDLARRPRSEGPPPEQASTSRISLLPSVRFPSRLNPLRQDTSSQKAPSDHPPILTLRLSSQSFLDCVITEDDSDAPIYTISTEGASTIVKRVDDGSQTECAHIRWPETIPARTSGQEATDGVEIELGSDRFLGGERLLQYGSKPNLKGAVAVLEPAKDDIPTKLTVYETMHDRYESRESFYHHGVYALLLDYLIVTALLLETDPQQWMPKAGQDGETSSNINLIETSSDGPTKSHPDDASGPSLWRKFLSRQPLNPKSSADSSLKLSTSDSHSSLPLTPPSALSRGEIYGNRQWPTRQGHPGESLLTLTTNSSFDEGIGDNEAVSTPPKTPLFSKPLPRSLPSSSHDHSTSPSLSRTSSHDSHSVKSIRALATASTPPVSPPRAGTPQSVKTSKSNPSLRASASASSATTRPFRELPRAPVPLHALSSGSNSNAQVPLSASPLRPLPPVGAASESPVARSSSLPPAQGPTQSSTNIQPNLNVSSPPSSEISITSQLNLDRPPGATPLSSASPSTRTSESHLARPSTSYEAGSTSSSFLNADGENLGGRVGRAKSMISGPASAGTASRGRIRPLPKIPPLPGSTSSSRSAVGGGATSSSEDSQPLRRARSHATLGEDGKIGGGAFGLGGHGQGQGLGSGSGEVEPVPPLPLPTSLPKIEMGATNAGTSGISSSSDRVSAMPSAVPVTPGVLKTPKTQRSLPPTPVVSSVPGVGRSGSGSGNGRERQASQQREQEEMQEELRIAAATIRVLREQHQRQLQGQKAEHPHLQVDTQNLSSPSNSSPAQPPSQQTPLPELQPVLPLELPPRVTGGHARRRVQSHAPQIPALMQVNTPVTGEGLKPNLPEANGIAVGMGLPTDMPSPESEDGHRWFQVLTQGHTRAHSLSHPQSNSSSNSQSQSGVQGGVSVAPLAIGGSTGVGVTIGTMHAHTVPDYYDLPPPAYSEAVKNDKRVEVGRELGSS